MSAIIDATTVRPAQPRYYELGLNLFHASALGATQFADGRGHALISARRSNVGDLAHSARTTSASRTTPMASARSTTAFDDATRGRSTSLVSSDAIVARQGRPANRRAREVSQRLRVGDARSRLVAAAPRVA